MQNLDKNMNIGKVSSELDWIIPTDFPEQFRLEGFPWFQENQGFIRLPKRLSKTFRAPVWELAHCCSGGQLHFATNSPTVNIRVKIPTAQKGTEHLPGPGEMYHMPATGQSGFDLYEKHDDHYEFLGISRFEVKKYSYMWKDGGQFSTDKYKFSDE